MFLGVRHRQDRSSMLFLFIHFLLRVLIQNMQQEMYKIWCLPICYYSNKF